MSAQSWLELEKRTSSSSWSYHCYAMRLCRHHYGFWISLWAIWGPLKITWWTQEFYTHGGMIRWWMLGTRHKNHLEYSLYAQARQYTFYLSESVSDICSARMLYWAEWYYSNFPSLPFYFSWITHMHIMISMIHKLSKGLCLIKQTFSEEGWQSQSLLAVT